MIGAINNWETVADKRVCLCPWKQNYMVVQVTPPGIQNLGWRFWIIWAVICFTFIPVTYLFYPETAGRTLEDIDRYFEGKPGIIVAFDNGKLRVVQCVRTRRKLYYKSFAC